jgi:hypothetical protein
MLVVTGWSPKGWKEYGQRFIQTFHSLWPESVKLVVYGEEPVKLPRGEFRRLSDIPGCMEFLERHDNPTMRGRVARDNWKSSEREGGYSWRYDAWKFCRQGFIPLHAAERTDEQLMCWLDADVITFKRVPEGFIEGLLPDGMDCAYLGRPPRHSEIGFQLYRLPQAMTHLQAFRDYYANDTFTGLAEWHSSWVFDQARVDTGLRAHNLTPEGRRHVWLQSPLAQYTDHLKGPRKKYERSPEARAHRALYRP